MYGTLTSNQKLKPKMSGMWAFLTTGIIYETRLDMGAQKLNINSLVL